MESVLETIGRTPLIIIEGVYVKCEFMNPSGSIKARVAKYIIEKAEQEGRIKPGDTIVEATSGNMGNALAMVAAAKGYKMLVLMPTGFSTERVAISRSYGAEVRFIGHFQLNEAVRQAKEMGSKKGFFCPSQFDNPLNIDENCNWLGKEIVDALVDGVNIDALVQGVGTGGTLIGVGRAIRQGNNQQVRLFAVEPMESQTIKSGAVSHHLIEGISDGFVPELYLQNQSEVEDVIPIDSVKAINEMKRLSSQYGLLVGPSSGANLLAAKEIKHRYPEIENVLTLFCDEGEKYLTQHYSH